MIKSYAADTSPDAHRRHVANIRAMTPAERVAAAFDLSAYAIERALAIIQRQRPSISVQQARVVLLQRLYGVEFAARVRQGFLDWKPTMHEPLYRIVTPVVEAFEDLSIAYYIGGSVASITYGMPRSTMDVDIITDMQAHDIDPLIARLSPLGYLDTTAAREAVYYRSSFNLIPSSGPAKLAMFVSKGRPFDQSVFDRRRYLDISPDAPRPYALPSPEDIILLKLEWYEATNRASIDQWPDILGVLQSQDTELDRAYLRRWASILGLHALLEQAIVDAGISQP